MKLNGYILNGYVPNGYILNGYALKGYVRNDDYWFAWYDTPTIFWRTLTKRLSGKNNAWSFWKFHHTASKCRSAGNAGALVVDSLRSDVSSSDSKRIAWRHWIPLDSNLKEKDQSGKRFDLAIYYYPFPKTPKWRTSLSCLHFGDLMRFLNVSTLGFVLWHVGITLALQSFQQLQWNSREMEHQRYRTIKNGMGPKHDQ